MIIIQIKLFQVEKTMLPSPYIQTYLLSPQLRALSLELMGASPSSISPEIFQIFFPVVTLMPVECT